MKFSEWNFNEDLLRGIDETGYVECMPVQELTYREVFKGKDILVQSQTGSGKTAAFLIPIFQLFLESEAPREKKALIIVPTRELAVQIEKEAELLGRHLDLVIGSFYGGVGYTQQEKLIREGVNIIIGTPGRLIDFNQSGKLKFNDIDILVIDEADRLFDMGFYPDLKKMLKRMKPREERRTMLFSATLSVQVKNLAWEHMNEPADVSVSPENMTVDNITQGLYHVGRHEKMKLLLGLLNSLQPKNVLVFTNTKQAAFEVAQRLGLNGYNAEYIIGDLPQSKRQKVIDGMKNGTVPYLVATDVAARGLHINDLELVVNYDLPEDCENYVHRIGRTARAGKSGNAISLSCEKYVYGLEAIEAFTGIKIPVLFADDSLYVEDKSAGRYFNLERSKHKFEEAERGRGGRGRDGRGKTTQDTRKIVQRKKPERTRPHAAVSAGTAAVAKEEAVETIVRRPARTNTGKRTGEARPVRAQSPVETGRGKRPAAASPVKKADKKPAGKTRIEDRLKYYSEKYGENFTASSELLEKDRQKRSLLQKIKGVFRRS